MTAMSTDPQARGLSRAMKTVLLVDDHPTLRAGLRLLIEKEPDLQVIGEAETEDEGVARLEAGADVAVVDIGLREGNGIDLICRIRTASPATRVVAFTMYAERVFGERCLRAGAAGFVNKQDPPTAILEAIRTVLDDRFYFSSEFTQQILNKTRQTRQRSEGRNLIDLLSTRELDVFRLLGEGLTTQQIAARLKLATSTIETYRDRLKTKLQLSSGSQLMREATIWNLDSGGYSPHQQPPDTTESA